MPYRIDKEEVGGWLVVRATGSFTVEQAIDALELLLEEEDFVLGLGSLWDLRRAWLGSWDRAAIQRFIDVWEGLFGHLTPGRAALVVGGDLAYGLGRMLEALAELRGLEVRTCHDLDKARTWLRTGPTLEDIPIPPGLRAAGP